MGVRGSKIGRTRAETAHVKNELVKKTPQVSIHTQSQKGDKLNKPCKIAVEGYIDCKGTIAELWKEAKQFLFMFKNMMKFLNDDNNCPLAKGWCMKLVKTTHTLENMWRAFFKKNEWGENGEKGLQHIVNGGFRNIPAIRNDLLKIHGGNERTQKMLEKRAEPLIAEHFRCIEVLVNSH
ncbi:hypothetical protein CRE_00605 [Caenorhabditis remanei]|uniref:Uncharacterized protein n=1 Tax=Caenorhabditis remanei TaxID=31234 RepID=E3LDE4_CAERE|nr:hypothetical protein CRE_00605 [Caenorhabditis remanei]